MRSLRRLDLVLILLVLAPTAVLAVLSLQAAERYREEAGARLRRDLDVAEETFRRLARALVGEDRARSEARVRAAAAELERRLPLEPVHAVFRDLRERWGHEGSERRPGTPALVWAPDGVRLRIVDTTGRTRVPTAFPPDATAAQASDRERLLEELRREADAQLFGRDDPLAAQAVWSQARARFASDDLKALADVEATWTLARRAGDPSLLHAAVDRLHATWSSDLLERSGRAWVLLLLRAAGGAPAGGTAARDALGRMHDSGRLAETPLTDEERERVETVVQAFRTPFATGVEDRFTAPLPAGLELEVRRALPPARVMAGRALAGVVDRWPAGPPPPLVGLPPPEALVLSVPREEGRVVELPLPGGRTQTVLLRHPEAAGLEAALRVRRRWMLAGIGALVVLVVVGLHLATRAIAREREARRLRDDFLANVSHELRTPLTAVCLHADLLAEPALPDERRRAHAEVVRAEGARLGAMVDDLLDFAALERGLRRLEIEPVDLHAAVGRAVEPFRVLAERERVALQVEHDAGHATALADPHALARILANLVGNAWKHGRPSRDGAPGRIRLTVGDRRVTVRDDGPGIPAADRAHLFERFRRGAGAARTRGVGLGLALSRDLARAMGGDLVVVEDPDATVFRLTLAPVPPGPPETGETA